MDKQALIDSLRGGLIVSCQALPGEPMHVPEQSIMYLFARAAKQAGAIAIRTNGVEDVKAIKAETGLPVIGLIKRVYPGSPVYITPTLAEVDALVEAGADIVAADCTLRKRPDGQTVQTFMSQLRRRYPDLPLMADISTYEEGAEASALGADFISTTLSGYTDNSPKAEGPDVALVR
ncbi:MAG TPA: N-acetylmannosamine-6-phosphate 2-epimerase, partial [Clostridia bacterium]|nr:N-acetylmannosamine-6-phosphate 2-epimerase [Clostridia bacterium]